MKKVHITSKHTVEGEIREIFIWGPDHVSVPDSSKLSLKYCRRILCNLVINSLPTCPIPVRSNIVFMGAMGINHKMETSISFKRADVVQTH